jgi:hypothetical protein
MHGGFLCRDDYLVLDLWSPNRAVPISIRRSIRKHQAALLSMLADGDAQVCPSPAMHRWSWASNADGREICMLCKLLAEHGIC